MSLGSAIILVIHIPGANDGPSHGRGAPLTMLLSLIAVELTLKWNYVTDINEVTSTGQVIALVVGAMNLVIVLRKLRTTLREEYEVSSHLRQK